MNAISKIGAEQLPDGIHFNVPGEVYFAQQGALGSTDMKQLALDPVEWQFDRLHGEDKNTPAKIWGSGLHARTLEGADVFADRFRAPPVKPDDALVTVADLSAWLTGHGLDFKKSAAKPELIRLVKDADPGAIIWDEITAKFQTEVPEDRRLTAEMAAEINLAAEWMQADEMIAPIMKGGTFQGGAPEVTVIYHAKDVRRRARFDYLLPGRIIDLKRYSPWRNSEIPTVGITNAIGNFRYDLQAADYLAAFKKAAELFREGKVFGEEPYAGFLDEVFGTGELPKWVWVFVKGEGAPQPRVVTLPHQLTVFKVAQTQVDIAIQNYRTNVEKYGLLQDWRPIPGAIHLADEDFPAWFGRN